ncbi:unnamed protein product [Gongylonema pulchrum]|uniref:ARF7EP_C domain-containing protein n=1 Tax=Gongylonema pulchrum TaxID=637853 RepID=A0A183D7U6_9BILA|nr:unnamed protein product [Gongylonema pulchrum]
MTGEVGNTSSSEDSRESRNDDRDILKPKSGKRWLSNRELDRLRFENPGEATVIAALDIFAGSSKDGVRRSRRRRKQVVTVNAQYMPYHDVNGSLVMQSGELVRLCDCLRITCQGYLLGLFGYLSHRLLKLFD